MALNDTLFVYLVNILNFLAIRKYLHTGRDILNFVMIINV